MLIFGNYDFEIFWKFWIFKKKKKNMKQEKKRIWVRLNFVDFSIYEFKILKNLNILNIVKYRIINL